MRIRYQYVGMDYVAECDLTEKQARKRFKELKEAGTCMWVELVGEDDGNYMEILDSYDKTRTALAIASAMRSIFGR